MADLRRDRLAMGSVLPFFWRRGWLISPPQFQPTLQRVLFRATLTTLLLMLLQLPQGAGLMAAGCFALLLICACMSIEQRWQLSRRVGDLLVGASCLLALGAWLLWHDQVNFPWRLRFPAPWLYLLFFGTCFGLYLVTGLIGSWIWRKPVQLPPWRDYVARALAPSVF